MRRATGASAPRRIWCPGRPNVGQCPGIDTLDDPGGPAPFCLAGAKLWAVGNGLAVVVKTCGRVGTGNCKLPLPGGEYARRTAVGGDEAEALPTLPSMCKLGAGVVCMGCTACKCCWLVGHCQPGASCDEEPGGGDIRCCPMAEPGG
mmetsp:Transcript_97917/g.281706  ORF Transcript_97917/g.281706 Transcript_97917/m.281706 type:complete len:147 (+) Transcript_97917:85-525(+)